MIFNYNVALICQIRSYRTSEVILKLEKIGTDMKNRIGTSTRQTYIGHMLR